MNSNIRTLHGEPNETEVMLEQSSEYHVMEQQHEIIDNRKWL
jgi:hypothetical protein